MEGINAFRELFGDKLAALFIVGLAAYWLLALTPFLLPAWRAFSKRDRLPRPWLFVIIVGGLAYGLTEFAVTLFAIPGAVFLTFVAPSMKEAELLHDSWLLAGLDFFVEWWWTALPLAFFAMAAVLTRIIAQRWRKICTGLAT